MPLVVRCKRLKHAGVGVPIKLLHEGEGHGVTVEMKNGEIYRGHLNEAEDTMNCFMTGGKTMLSNFVCAAFQSALFFVGIKYTRYQVYSCSYRHCLPVHQFYGRVRWVTATRT